MKLQTAMWLASIGLDVTDLRYGKEIRFVSDTVIAKAVPLFATHDAQYFNPITVYGVEVLNTKTSKSQNRMMTLPETKFFDEVFDMVLKLSEGGVIC